MKEYLILICQIGLIAVTFHFIGKLVLNLLSIYIKEHYFRIYLNQMVGAIIFVVANAIYYTKGKTVMIAFIIIFFFIVIEQKNRILSLNAFDIKKNLLSNKTIISNLLILLVLTVATKVYLYNFNGTYTAIPNTDYGFYAKITSYLQTYRIENVSLEYIKPERFGVQPYHYFELWMNLGFSNLIENSHLYNYVMVTSSYGLWVLCIGFLAIIEIFIKEVNSTKAILAFFSTFFIGFNPSIYSKFKFMEVVDVFTVNPWFYQKLFPIYWFLIAALLFWNYKSKTLAFASLLCLPIVFISTAPSVMAAIGLYFMYIKLFKLEKWDNYSHIIFLSSFVFIFLILFYSLGKVGDDALDIKSSLQNMDSSSHIRTAINVVGGTSIQIIILLFPYILITGVNLRNLSGEINILKNLIIPVLIIGAALIFWSILNNTPNSVQVFTNISIPIINLLIFVGYIYLIYIIKMGSVKIISLFTMTFLLAHGMYQTSLRIISEQGIVNTAFINQLPVYKIQNKIGVYFNTTNEGLAVIVPTFHNPMLAYHLLLGLRNVDVISLSTFEIPIDSTNRYFNTNEKIAHSSTFYNYVENQKLSSKFTSINQSQVEFIEDNNIEYGIIAKNSQVSDLIKSKIINIYKDSTTGDTFVQFEKAIKRL